MSQINASTLGVPAGLPLYGSSASDFFGYSTALSFDGNRIVIGAPGHDTERGYVRILDYDETSNTWSQVGSDIIGPHLYSRFGHSVDITWNGDRVAVGSNSASNVYTYDFSNGSWGNEIVIDSSSVSFGHCVSLAQNFGTRLCVGAPDVNTIYVYEERNGNWDLDYSNVGTDFDNIVPLDSSSNIIVSSTYSQYGFHVQMSAFGEHVIVGAPGTRLLQIDSTNSDADEGDTYNTTVTHVDNPTKIIPVNSGSFQNGNVRVFRCPVDGDWTSGVTQVGSLLLGDPGTIKLSSWNPLKASLPGFGFKTHISYDGTIILVTSVEWSGGSERAQGAMYYYTYNIDTNDWDLAEVQYGGATSRFGWGSALTYDGSRYGATFLNKEQWFYLYDWNGNDFYDVTLPIAGISGYAYNIQNLQGFDASMVSGERFAISAPGYDNNKGSVHVFKFDLTSQFTGNSLFSGYIKVDTLYIGANNDSKDETKRIAFGGTYGDNVYDATVIENRTYNGDRSSELLLAKLPVNAGDLLNPDRVRIKAPSIIFDCQRGDVASTQSRYTESPVFVMNGYQCTGVGHGNVMGPRAQMDIIGDARASSKVTISSDRKMNWRAARDEHRNDFTEKEGCYLFYNTRDPNVITDGNVYSYNFHYITSQKSNGVPNIVTYDSTIKGIRFTGSSTSNVTTNDYVYKTFNRGSFREKVSFWFRCIDVTTSYEQVLDLGGNVLSVKQDAIKFNVNSTDYEATSLTIVNDRWYHIFIDIVRGNVANYSFTIYLDDVQIKSHTLSTPLNSFSDRIIFGGGLDGYIGTPLFSADETNQDRTELYNYGPPDEVLAVGGSATIAGKLGVGVTNPTEALEVSGNVYIDGEQSGFVVDAQGNKRVGLMKYVGYGGALVHGSGQRLDIGRSDTADVTTATTFIPEITVSTSGNVGVGTTNPQNILTVDSNDPVLKSATSTPDTSFNYVLIAPKPSDTSGGAVHFINGTNRTVDGGSNTYTIRNDSGPLRLGNDLYQTTVTGSSVQTRVGYIHRTISLRDANSGYTDLGSGVGLNLGTLQSGVTGSFNSPMIQRGIQSNFTSGDGALWEGNRIIVGFRYVALGTGLTGSVNSFRVYSNNYQTTTTTNYDWTAPDDGFDRGFMSTTSPPVISHTGDVPSIWLVNISAHSVRINAVWVEYVNI